MATPPALYERQYEASPPEEKIYLFQALLEASIICIFSKADEWEASMTWEFPEADQSEDSWQK